MSSCSSKLLAERAPGVPCVSLGYDRVRFLAAVFPGDTVKIHCEVVGVDPARGRTTAKVEAVNQRGETVAVAEHILKFV